MGHYLIGSHTTQLSEPKNFSFDTLTGGDICYNGKWVPCQSFPLDVCEIASAHASTLATSLMHEKNSTHHSCLWHLLPGTLEWRKWKKDKNIIVNTIISLTYIRCPCISLLEPRQNNLSNPEAYSELCQPSKMKCFAKIVNVSYVCHTFDRILNMPL